MSLVWFWSQGSLGSLFLSFDISGKKFPRLLEKLFRGCPHPSWAGAGAAVPPEPLFIKSLGLQYF
ncbi:hypothetical protein LEP1GSC050_1902 [Leptospira broomii serovar Hurstbridge str. 5399]|uniref:Uncharacterized protein n=1 Tax=Leptospira broomii serovar Hurstbridge str. 5399 TaxID=1049789 RepID=T0EY37_9LEPT|nr:hypothetical protein LEP1GSC050_1902 [Leptospira broomii serovar Hurstbridge str. 5399]